MNKCLRPTTLVTWLALFLGSVSQSGWSQGQPYTITNLQFINGNGLNDKGQVVGTSSSGAGFHPVIWDAINGFQDLPVPLGFDLAEGSGINNLGQVSGNASSISNPSEIRLFYWDKNRGSQASGIPGLRIEGGAGGNTISDSGEIVASLNFNRAVLWSPTNGLQDLGTACQDPSNPGQFLGFTRGNSISRNGTFVIGTVSLSPGECNNSNIPLFYSAVWTAGTWTALNPVSLTDGVAVNDLGQVAGTLCSDVVCHAALWTNNVPQDLGTLPGDTNSTALNLNDSGQVVGNSSSAQGVNHPFIWDSINGMRDLNSLIPLDSGVTLRQALAINNVGQILADSTGSVGHTFLLSPQGCQTNVPSAWGQADQPWGPVTYDSYDVALCQSHPPTRGECMIGNSNTCCRMKSLGCTTTALAMALNAAGVFTLPDSITSFSALDPGSFNSFMNLHADYNSSHDVDIELATLDVNLSTLSLRGGKRIHFDDSLRGDPSLSTLKAAVCAGHPVVVTVAAFSQTCIPNPGASPGGHYVLVTGEHDDINGTPHFDIIDPGCRLGDLNASPPIQPIKSLDAYNNNFIIRGFVADPTDVSTLQVETDNNADLLIIDASGNRTGFDPESSVARKEIAQSSYGQDFLTDNDTGEAGGVTHSVNVFQPSQGVYQISVTGLKLGTYNLSIASFSTDGVPQPRFSFAGITNVSSRTSFQIQFSSIPGATSTVILAASFENTLADIRNSFQLGLIDNDGIANSLSSKIRNAADAVGRDRQNILNAFINEVTSQSGKHITDIAIPLLVNDARSLIAQNR